MIALSARIASLKETVKDWQETKEIINLFRLFSQTLLEKKLIVIVFMLKQLTIFEKRATD
jgi:hypothetical protein